VLPNIEKWTYILPLSGDIGMGHLVRCHRLASKCVGCQHEFTVVTHWNADDVEQLLSPFPTSVVSPYQAERTLCKGSAITQLAVDFPEIPDWVEQISLNSKRNLVLGASLNNAPWASLIVNVAEGEDLSPQAIEYQGRIRILQGAAFAVLPSPAAESSVAHGSDLGPLVVFGGTDAGRKTLPVAKRIVDERVFGKPTVITSSNHPDWDHLVKLSSQRFINLYGFTRDLPTFIQNASIVVTAPGNILLECFAHRTPAITIAVNERQAKDFSAYPWMLTNEKERELPKMIRKLMSDDRQAWLSYAKQIRAGQFAGVICEWMENPDCDLRSRMESLGVSLRTFSPEKTKC
jgi:spore coat polysaccharide biosynthesis predicted glycosyltransferase SpsG